MAGAGLASCSQPIPSYTVMGNIPDSTFNGKTVVVQRPRYWQKCITNTRIKDSKYLV